MCGIAGIISKKLKFDSNPRKIVQGMLDSIAHRGPDGSGIIENHQFIFGHNRLAIIDLVQGAQPMCSADSRYTLTFNGEIYNYEELRKYLEKKGVSFNTKSDTEVLLKLLIHEREDGIKKLNGMFAFAFHDKSDNSWIMSRDHFGIKPLYYTKHDSQIIFSSEIKAILTIPFINKIKARNEQALQEYLTFQFCLEEKTLFKGINKVKPGYYLTGKGSVIEKEVCFYNCNYNIDYKHTEDYFIDKLKFLLEDSVKLQLRSDVPLGGYLSGGLDSSIVCSLAGDLLNDSIPVFHGKFSESVEYDESLYAKKLSGHINGEYHEIIPSENDFVESIPKLIYALDEPLAGPGIFPQYHVSKLASKHVTVCLGGQGGDEIFGGYARYLVAYLEQALKGSIFQTQEEGKHLVSLNSIVDNLPLLKNYKPLLKHFFKDGLFDSMDSRYFHLIDRSQGLNEVLDNQLVNSFNKKELFETFQKVFNHPKTSSYINKMTYFDQKTLLPALLQIEDRVSMSVSLESRVPLLDSRIVDLTTSMPPPLKFQGGKTKYILKKATKEILPKLIYERSDKMGFPVPLSLWMKKGIVRDFISDTLLSKASLKRGIYKPEALNKMISDSGVGARKLWGALSLELWHQTYIDG